MSPGTSIIRTSLEQEETMNFIISGATPNPAAATTPRTPAPKAVRVPAAKQAPVAIVEISSAAKQAHSAGQEHATEHKMRPLNIIWGNGPK